MGGNFGCRRGGLLGGAEEREVCGSWASEVASDLRMEGWSDLPCGVLMNGSWMWADW